MDIRINVVGQKLIVSSNYIKLIGGSNKFIKFIFALDSSWDDLLPYAQFTQDGVPYNVYLDDKKSVFLPPEIKDGTCTLTLGGSGNGVIATTDYVKFNITGSILSEGQESTDITESMYEQLVDKVNSVRDEQSGLRELVSTEKDERVAADNAIQQSVTSSISNIEDDIATIQVSIDDLSGYDTALSQRITSEGLIRATSDASLQAQIDEYKSSVEQTISSYETDTNTSLSDIRNSITGVRTAINNDIEDVKDDLRDAVSILNSRMDLALQQINKHEIQTILFEDESDPLAYVNDKATLSDDPTTFDYIDFYYKTHVNSSGQGNWDKVFRFEPNSSQPTIVSVQPSDASATNKTLYVHELSFSISGLSITVVRSRRWYWNGNANAAASLQQSDESSGTSPDNMYGGRVYKIIGVNISDIDELTDLRIGTDGTVYQSAGTAIRTQLSDIQNKSASDVSYDAANSGLVSNNVQDAIDEIVDEIVETSNELNERLVQQAELTSDLKADAATSFSWVQGGINTNIGTNTEDNTRIRSSGFKSYDGCESVTVTIPSDYQAVAIELNGTGSPQRDYFVRSIPDSGYTAHSFSFVPVEGYYYRFCIKRTSNEDISPAQVPSGFAVTEQRKRIPNIFETMFNTNIGNCGILCAKEHNFVDGTAPTYEWYLLGDPKNNAVYYSKDMTTKEYLFTFGETLGYWSFGIDSNNNIICCKQSEYLSESLEHDDGLRVNPIVYLFSEKYSIPHEVDFGESLKPCGWLSSVGFICLADGSILIAEYTRPVVSTANIWRISGTPTNAANWSVRQTFDLSGSGTGFKHIHCVQQDFYTGICYFSTGDDDTSSHWYYSTDNGITWVLGKGNSEKYCRFLNLIFTPEYIYWSTDSNKVGYHWMFKAARKSNGILDFENITDLLEIPLVASLATYGCCYFSEYKALLLMERCDNEVQMEMPVRLYDIDTNTLHTVGTLTPAARLTGGGHLGFRTRFCTWYPKRNAVKCAWHLRGTSVGSRGFNENAMFGNLGMPDASNNINNAEIRIYKDSGTYRMALDTAYI